MTKELLPDALWARIAPLLPPEPPKPKGGRPRVSDRASSPCVSSANHVQLARTVGNGPPRTASAILGT